jgi:hypothetical protein
VWKPIEIPHLDLELTMTLRSLSIAAVATAIAGAPMLGVAADSQQNLDNCVKAFMTSLAAKSTTTLKLREAHYANDDDAPESHLMGLSGGVEMTLTARDAHDNHAVARSVCAVNSSGEVVELRPAPLFD